MRAPSPAWVTWSDEGLLPGEEITAGLATLDAVQRVTVAGVPPYEGDEGPMHYSPFPGGRETGSRGGDLEARNDLCVQLRDDSPCASPRRKATSFAE